ncbi:tripartite tricarboxylate transporter substrate binding protein [Siccirubricoccus sp. KC 17139]|uniref:Tripartite tricarboxylate transporter substrate binding protein n=1 Tax=Siccirubricoccus soli TaxID=2899147 RepID=A0ABT1D6J8_9PROT|nr:tripartite tricarboxylate transporter substrate binding protein [Siccirubricoccus soli]MCO6417548.1 tripartite tricarboxylate transporter substrate binding protein [Siccirubricoccus soli]MCP2683683.1 tripartite tricarboxylate transporter substrate binding protein [Siccirubricoccus soli]
MQRRALLLATPLLAAPLLRRAAAQPRWAPDRPVRIIVAFPPGGSTDVVSRLIASPLGEALGQPVVIENRGGASGMIGTEVAARAAPDGHTLLMTASGPQAINPSLFPSVPYEPVRGFAPILLVAIYPLLMVAPMDRAPRSVAEFVAQAKAQGGRLNYCSIGTGQPSHLAGELFKSMAGIEMTHVPYRGSGPAVTAVVAGECDVLFDSALSSGPQVRGGRLRALAVTTKERISSWPDLPTIAEAGLPGYDAYTWNALMAPAGTPPAAIERLNAEVGKILTSPAFRSQLEAQGAVPGGGTSAEMGRFLEAEIAKWAEVIRAGNIRPD